MFLFQHMSLHFCWDKGSSSYKIFTICFLIILDYVYVETAPVYPYQIRRIEELTKVRYIPVIKYDKKRFSCKRRVCCRWKEKLKLWTGEIVQTDNLHFEPGPFIVFWLYTISLYYFGNSLTSVLLLLLKGGEKKLCLWPLWVNLLVNVIMVWSAHVVWLSRTWMLADHTIYQCP